MLKTVFTNGCFDILHPGHIDLLTRARALGDRLVVGINSDRSVRRIKGEGRPLVDQEARRQVLLALRSVDSVQIFDEPSPERLIREIKPAVLVKGGDWQTSEIIGADFVLENGGEVHSLPLYGEYSTTKIIDGAKPASLAGGSKGDSVERSADEHIEVFEKFRTYGLDVVRECADLVIQTFKRGGKLLICGNGGSAADAQHIAAEFVGRYETERVGLPAIALTTDTSALTALANDYDFERIFSRQVEALATAGDCLIAISTSGNSANVLAAVMTARKKGCTVIGMTGEKGTKLAGLSDICFMSPSIRTARTQEVHITAAHMMCELVDDAFAAG
jgi:D-sedoheptulose 7-phosphate isomerase